MTEFVERYAATSAKSMVPYQPGKPIEELTRELGITDVIKLASNENPRGPGAGVQRALNDAGPELSRYPDGNGFALKQALSAHLDVAPDQITLGSGSNDVIDLLARISVTGGKAGIITQHAFVAHALGVLASGGRLVSVPARDWGVDTEAMLDAVTDDTRIVLIANPNNPTGTWISNGSLTTLLDGLPEHVLVVLDEAYFEYVEEDDYPDGISLLSRYPNLVVTRTFSKIHGLAALRVGYAVSHPDVAELMNRVRLPFNVSSVALGCALAALGDAAFVEESRRLNREGMAQLCRGLDQLGIQHIPSIGNFVSMGMGRDAAPIYEALLQRGVIVRPIAGYGMPNHLRVTVGLPQENARFLDALTAVC
jgi:histidinol-phosphate aminotransferase